MSTLEDLDDMERDGPDESKKAKQDGDDAEMQDADKTTKDGKEQEQEQEEVIDADILNSSTRDIVARRRLLENDTRIMRSEFQRLTHEKATMNEKIKDNQEKIQNNR